MLLMLLLLLLHIYIEKLVDLWTLKVVGLHKEHVAIIQSKKPFLHLHVPRTKISEKHLHPINYVNYLC